MRLLIATHNAGKELEYRELLAQLGARICFPDDLGIHLNVREDGVTYAQNARKKATRYTDASGMVTLADDSGLEVDALDGAPGVHSARYTAGDDAHRIDTLLHDLHGVPWEERTARFRCVIVMVTPGARTYEAEGTCEGIIKLEPEGDGGFGYDPIFYLPQFERTLAQLPPQEKNQISHRARAVQAALPVLRRILEHG
jgi:XTP/dITP diphosphohydrolase